MKKLLLIILLIVGCDESSTSPITAVSNNTTYMENIYIQTGGVGMASYHFDSYDNVYINYSTYPETVTPEGVVVPFPEKKYFINKVFTDDRIFKGTIDWTDAWFSITDGLIFKYEMVFSSDFKSIISGNVRIYDGNSEIISHYPTVLYGTDLIYILSE